MNYSSDESTTIRSRTTYERKRRKRLRQQELSKSESEDEIETSPLNFPSTSTTCQNPDTLHSEPEPEPEPETDPSETDPSEHDFLTTPEVSDEEAYYDSSSESASISSPPTIKEDLKDWALKYNIPASTALNDLLRILVSHGNDSLPIDARSLLNTPRSVQVERLYDGDFYYFGLRQNILEQFQKYPKLADCEKIKLIINIDGVPLSKSSKLCCWPILGRFASSDVFLICIYSERHKPDSPLFLDKFINELISLNSGQEINSKHYSFSVLITADAPAREFIKATAGHCAHHACERCKIIGYSIHRRTIFPIDEAPLRTDEEFNNYRYMGSHQDHQDHQSHQLNVTPLVRLTHHMNFSCIKDVVLDYMHLVLLGVVKRILSHICSTKKLPVNLSQPAKLSELQISQINQMLFDMRNQFPSEFQRKPRTLDQRQFFKATEFRLFLLYTGPIVLKGIVKREFYEHFLLLSCGIRILATEDQEFRNGTRIDIAQKMLKTFVENAEQHYGKLFAVYNIHNLLHLHEDVRNHNAALDAMSSFAFENFNQQIKKSMRKKNQTVSQIIKRNAEGLFHAKREMRQSHSIKYADSCYKINDNTYCFIKKEDSDDASQCICNVFNIDKGEPLFKKPVDSKIVFGIVCFEKAPSTKPTTISKSLLKKKVAIIKVKNKYIFYPLVNGLSTTVDL